MKTQIRNTDCYMASFPRNNHSDLHVIDTALSILKNKECATLTIELCDKYSEEEINIISDNLRDERVVIYMMDNAKHSNQKLKHIGCGENPYICLIDDDLIYNENYLSYMIQGCEHYQAHVSLHGIILYPRPIRSYYADRIVYRGLTKLDRDYQIDIASNCMVLFRRDWYPDLDKWFDEAPTISMDDILTSLKAKQRAIPMFVLKHDEGFVTHKKQLPDEIYVFTEYTKQLGVTDKFQTDFINANF